MTRSAPAAGEAELVEIIVDKSDRPAITCARAIIAAGWHKGPRVAEWQPIARAICAETCAFKGEPACYDVTDNGKPLPWPAPACDEPGCEWLAKAVLGYRKRAAPPEARPAEGELREAVAKELCGIRAKHYPLLLMKEVSVSYEEVDAAILRITAHARKAMAEEVAGWCEQRSAATVGECQSDSSAAYQNVAAHIRRIGEGG
jgi:hypothetical protein